MKQAQEFVATMWRPALGYVIGGIALLALLVFSLDKLVPGLSPQEVAARANTGTLKDILDNVVYGPHKILQFGVMHFKPHSIILLRSVSALFGAISVLLFYLLIKNWFSQYVAILSTLLYFTSSWFLGLSRLATPTIMLTMLVAVVYTGQVLRSNRNRIWPWLVACGVFALSLYIPGFMWFMLGAAAWQFRRLRHSFERLRAPAIAACAAILVIFLAPLILCIIRYPDTIWALMGVPKNPGLPLEIGKNILRVPAAIFIRSQPHPVYWLGVTPMLDVLTTAFFILGAYSYFKHWRLDRSWLIFSVFIVGTIWIGISGIPEHIAILLPFVYIVVAAGISWLLEEWFSVFPRNPIARSVGSCLIAIAVIVACNYHITRYFIAWPNNAATQKVFVQKI